MRQPLGGVAARGAGAWAAPAPSPPPASRSTQTGVQNPAGVCHLSRLRGLKLSAKHGPALRRCKLVVWCLGFFFWFFESKQAPTPLGHVEMLRSAVPCPARRWCGHSCLPLLLLAQARPSSSRCCFTRRVLGGGPQSLRAAAALAWRHGCKGSSIPHSSCPCCG